MKTEVTKKSKAVLELKIVVSAQKVKEAYDDVLTDVVTQTEIPGFRKGNAPKDKVLERTDVSKLYGEVVNVLLQTYYPQALKENHIAPVSNPKVEIKEFDLEKDFEFVATVATRPEVKIGDYKKAIENLHKKENEEQRKINAEKLKNGEAIESTHAHLKGSDMVDAIISVSQVEVADILIEDEVDRMMTRLVDQAQSIGLSLENYLKSQNKTAEQLREEYSQIAEKSLKGEFILSELIKTENIEVSDQDVSSALSASGIEGAVDKMQDPVEKWYIKSVLEKNRLLVKLAEEVEGKHDHAE